jgi:prepilin peptidase CpaA
MSFVFTVPLVLALVAGAAMDVWRNRIPNRLVLAALPLAALAAVAMGGLGALPSALAAGGIAFLIGFASFAAGAIGGGDAKFMVVGALAVGLGMLLPFLLAFAALGGALALIVVVRRRAGVEAVVMTGDLVKHAATLGRKGHRARLGDEGRLTVPYGVAIAAAALACLFTPYPEWLLG